MAIIIDAAGARTLSEAAVSPNFDDIMAEIQKTTSEGGYYCYANIADHYDYVRLKSLGYVLIPGAEINEFALHW